MSPGKVQTKVLRERLEWARRMYDHLRALPLSDPQVFAQNPDTVAAAESYLRRCLEALLDLGRHILAKGYGRAALEYKAIAKDLLEVGVLTPEEARVLSEMAGYRNRLVHFYAEVTPDDLYETCAHDLDDIVVIAQAFERWAIGHPERLDTEL